MRKSLLGALLLIALMTLVCIFSTGGKTTVALFDWSWAVATPLALLGSAAIGVVVGVLLK